MMSSLPARRASLRHLLNEYRPATELEHSHAERLTGLLALPSDPFSREHYEPGHVTASAFILSPEGHDLLLIHHRKLRRWLQPGGHIEMQDVDVLAAARREATEESGIVSLTLAQPGIFDLDVHDIPAFGPSPAHMHFDVRFLFQSASLELRASDEVAGAKWVTLSNIADYESDESVLRAVKKLPAAREI